MFTVPAAICLTLASLACLALAPIALAVAVAVVTWGAVADVEVAIVVSRRRPDGRKGQAVVASARTTPRRAARAVVGGVVGAAGAARTAGAAVVETARRTVARWADTEQAARLADRARAAADIGPAALTLAAVWALPWIAIASPDGAGAAVGVGAALALARWGVHAGGIRYRVDA